MAACHTGTVYLLKGQLSRTQQGPRTNVIVELAYVSCWKVCHSDRADVVDDGQTAEASKF